MTTTIHALGGHTPVDRPPHGVEHPYDHGSGRARGEFSLELGHAAEAPERPAGGHESTRAARRRVPVRFARRTSEIHRHSEHAIEETQHKDPPEHGFSSAQEEPEAPEESPDESQQEAEDAGAQDQGRDFLELQAQLARLHQQPLQEVTLYLPSLGQITARSVAGGVSVELAVPLRHFVAMQRAQQDLRLRLQRTGLVVVTLALRVLPAYLDDEEPLAEAGGAHGLVDVLA